MPDRIAQKIAQIQDRLLHEPMDDALTDQLICTMLRLEKIYTA